MVEPLGRQLPWRAIHTRQALSRTDHAGPMPVFVFDFAFVSIFVAMFFVTQKQIYFKISGDYQPDLGYCCQDSRATQAP